MKIPSYKELAAGALIYNAKTNSVLLGRSPGKKVFNWTIFKGKLEEDETFISAARRETEEECGIDLGACHPISIGGSHVFCDYIVGGNKLVRVFFYEFRGSQESAIKNCKCTTYFQSKGKTIPEIVEFRWFNFEDIFDHCFRSQIDTLKYAKKILESKYINPNK